MDANQKELFRKAILQVLDLNRTRFGLAPSALRLHLGQFGFPMANVEQVEEEVQYLAGKGLAEEVVRVISKENRCWRITKPGISFLDENG
jgi:hypothetical protein